MMQLLRDFWVLTRRYNRGRWAPGLIMIMWYVIKASPLFLLPVYIGVMVDLAEQQRPGYLWEAAAWSVGMLLIVIQNRWTNALYFKQLSWMARSTGCELREAVCRRLQELSLLFHKRAGIGRLQAKVVRDIDVIENQLKTVVEPLFNATAMAGVASVTLLVRAPWALPVAVLAVGVAVFIQWAYRKRIKAHATEYRRRVESMTSELQDMIEMIPVTRAHGLEETALRRAEPMLHAVRAAGVGFDMIGQRFGATSWVSVVCIQVGCLLGSLYAHSIGWFTVGDIVMFNSFFTTTTAMLMGLLSTVPMVSQIRDSFDSVEEILVAGPVEKHEGKPALPRLAGRFEIRNVRFRYPDTDSPAIDGLNLVIEPGTNTAIVGPSGGGKSTLLSLLMGFLTPQEGTILVDGIPMDDLDLRSVRRRIGVVRQEATLFSGSIRDNVAFGMEQLDPARLRWALEQANAWDFVSRLPDGVETRIGQDGQALSGGQMQRLAIARALLRDPAVLILDEPTSALDPESEFLVRQALTRAIQGRTAITVTHGLHGVRHADRIIVVEDGRVAAEGDHDTLLLTDNFYSRSTRAMHELARVS